MKFNRTNAESMVCKFVWIFKYEFLCIRIYIYIKICFIFSSLVIFCLFYLRSFISLLDIFMLLTAHKPTVFACLHFEAKICGYCKWNTLRSSFQSSWSKNIFIYAQNFCFTISLFHASTCFEHMCSSSGGQNCITQPLVSSHLWVWWYQRLCKAILISW